MCHVWWVKASLTPQETTTWTLDSHLMRPCTLKRRQLCAPARASRRHQKKKKSYRSLLLNFYWVGGNINPGSGNIEGREETQLDVSNVKKPSKTFPATTVKYALCSLADFYSTLMTPSHAVSLEKFCQQRRCLVLSVSSRFLWQWIAPKRQFFKEKIIKFG